MSWEIVLIAVAAIAGWTASFMIVRALFRRFKG